jgi:hypothetical protein
MPSSGIDTPTIGERLFHVPFWMVGILFLVVWIGIVAGVFYLAKVLTRVMKRVV